MKPKAFLVFAILTVVLGLVTVIGGYNYITKEARRLSQESLALTPVVVAAADIEPGQRLEGKDVHLAQWPSHIAPAVFVTAPAQVVGKIANTGLVKGEVVVPAKLAGETPKLSLLVPKGQLAMTVKVDDVIGVSGFVKAGDRVDMLVTMDKEPYKENPISKVVLQDVGVLAVGTQLHETKDDKAKKYTVVTLQLTPEQAEKVAIAVTEGRVLLALRNLNDRDEYRTNGQFIPTLISGGAMPRKAAEPAALAKGGQGNSRAMEIIRGLKKSDDEY